MQHRFGDEQAEYHHKKPAANSNCHSGVDGVEKALFILRTRVTRHQHVDPGTDAEKEIQHQHSESRSRAHRRHRFAGGKLSQHDQVGCVKHQREHIAEHKRNGKFDDLAKQRPVGHINFIFFSHNKSSLIYRG